jgi:hypothetical protein
VALRVGHRPSNRGVTLKIRTNLLTTRARGAIGGVLASAVLLVSTGVGTQGAAASSYRSAGESAFCNTILTYHPTTAPSPTNLKSYQAWAKTLEPFYEKLASEAPNAATKSVLNEVVVVLKYYVSSKNLAKLDANVLKYHAKWAAGSYALARAVGACAKAIT